MSETLPPLRGRGPRGCEAGEGSTLSGDGAPLSRPASRATLSRRGERDRREQREIKTIPPDPSESRAFFGRRKGKRLRPAQGERLAELLPRLRVTLPEPGAHLDPPALFPVETDEVWLEIGFGGGEHLAAQAQAHPRVGIVGCEPFVNGVVKLLREVDERRLPNVRIWDEDATALLAALPDASLARVYLLYPDPWPKRRQRKRRFVSDASLQEIARVLKPGGHFRFASDIDDYCGWTLARAARSAALRWTAQGAEDWRRPFPGWPGTRYEAKAIREGRTPSYLTFVREPG